MDDTFIIKKTEYKDKFLNHVSSTDFSIHFTTEDPSPGGSMPFSDTLETPGRTLPTVEYRKHTHTGHYLHWDNQHNLFVKYMSAPSNTEQEMFVPAQSFYKRMRPFKSSTIPIGLSACLNKKTTTNITPPTGSTTSQQITIKKTSTRQYYTPKG